VGGGFGDDGVHNVLEAAVYGRPVIFGPEYDKYAEAVGLVAAGGAFDVENALELEKTLDILLSDGQDYRGACESAGKFVQDNTGATGIVMNYIQEKRLFTS
jgi:3-deoxy-D-manno-octulosonic-acid transferase